MSRPALALLLIACSAPQQPDAGRPDSGPPDSGPPAQQACVASSCDVGGNWQVIFTAVGFPPPIVCRPVDEQIRFTANGSALCMLRAVDGGSDGGCGFSFVLQTESDAGIVLTDTWDLHQADAGHIYGTWSTQATGAASCTGTYSVHAVK